MKLLSTAHQLPLRKAILQDSLFMPYFVRNPKMRAFAEQGILKGIICHGLWLCAPKTELVRGRRMTVHNNLIGDARAYGVSYVDADLVVDRDLVSARTGGHCHLLARTIIELLAQR